MAVDSLSIGRLHTRYVGVDTDMAGELDDVLRDVVQGSLEHVAQDLLDGGGRSPWAVCIASVDVGIEFDLGRPRDALASQWARNLVEAVVLAVESADASGDVAVVFRTEQDALCDLVVGVARGRFDHHWAWRQLAFVGDGAAPPSGIEVANALAARPAVAPAVIAACRADAWRVIDPIGWILIAGAVQRANPGHLSAHSSTDLRSWPGSLASTNRTQRLPDGEADRNAAHDGGRSGDTAGTQLVERIVAAVPMSAWSAAAEGESRALALLAITMMAPHATHRSDLVDAVVARTQRGGAGQSPASARPSGSPSAAPASTSTSAPLPSAAAEPDESAIAAPIVRTASAFGGVWYLVRLITELDVMVRLARHDAALAPDLLAAVVGRVTGVSPEDPAIALLAGTADTDDANDIDDVESGDRSPTDADADAPIVRALAAELIEELTQRGGARLAGRDLGELWARRAEMTVGVGAIDVRFDLDDVDLDVRAIGLDADPGFVWWSGSIVRFDYV